MSLILFPQHRTEVRPNVHMFVSVKKQAGSIQVSVSERLVKGMNAAFLLVYNWSL